MIYRNKPSDCLRPPLIDEMPMKCQQLKHAYGQCKRGMVDMRKRFRGNQPVSLSQELEGGTSGSVGSGGQLYAGKPAFGDVKTTSGNEPEERDWRDLENEAYRNSKS
jgi:cytochrome c oxidase assembly factor 5